MQSVWVLTFHATNSIGEQMDIGPFAFSTEQKAKRFVESTLEDEMQKRIAALDDWQQQEVMRDAQGHERTLEERVEQYYEMVDELGESSLTWTLDPDVVDSGDVKEARKVFDFLL
jgi:hypothetical protein